MACPDELILDLWLAGVLPSEEAASVAAHVRTCAACAAAVQTARALDAELHAALVLDAEERAYVSILDLAGRWRPRRATGPAPFWGWIALVGVVGGYVAWLAAAALFGEAVGPAVRFGLGAAPLYLAIGLALDLGHALLDLVRHPALGLSQPLLVLFALALLLWPRQLIPQRSTQS